MFIKRYIEASKKEAEGIKNIIKKRMFLAYRLKIADIMNDLKTFDKFKKYFVEKNEADEKLKELQEQQKNDENVRIDSKDIDWYEPMNKIREFYVYSLDKDEVNIGKCYLLDFMRRGYDDFVTLGGLYKTDSSGKEIGSIIGYKIMEKQDINGSIPIIQNEGIKGYGKTYYPMNNITATFSQIQNFAKTKLKKILEEKQNQQQSA